MTRSALLAIVFFFLLLTAPASAATAIIVTTTDDTIPSAEDHGECTLRQAITAAQTNSAFGGCNAAEGDDLILLPGGEYRLSATAPGEDGNLTGDLDVFGSDSLAIQTTSYEEGAVIRGGGTDRVLQVLPDAQFYMRNVTITGGDANTGAGDGDYGFGGGIDSGGTLLLDGVSVIGNTASDYGGGLAASGNLEVVNSTIGLNKAYRGGGVFLASADADIRSSTIARNTAVSGGGIYVPEGNPHSEEPGTTLDLTNVINASNYGSDCSAEAGLRPRYVVTTQEFNELDCNAPGEKDNLVVDSPHLAPLSKSYPTWIFPLLQGSAAIRAGGFDGESLCPSLDQRFLRRPPGQCDIGAVQFTGTYPYRGLGLRPPSKGVRIGRNRTIRIPVSAGNYARATANDVKLCVRELGLWRRLSIKGPTCRQLGDLKSRDNRRVQVRVAWKRDGHQGSILRFRLSAPEFATTSARIKIKRH